MSEYDTWAPIYDAWAAHMTEDVAHYVSLAREADGPIVELMVGSGRVAIEVVRETGKSVLGIDSSPAMLEVARELDVVRDVLRHVRGPRVIVGRPGVVFAHPGYSFAG